MPGAGVLCEGGRQGSQEVPGRTASDPTGGADVLAARERVQVGPGGRGVGLTDPPASWAGSLTLNSASRRDLLHEFKEFIYTPAERAA